MQTFRGLGYGAFLDGAKVYRMTFKGVRENLVLDYQGESDF